MVVLVALALLGVAATATWYRIVTPSDGTRADYVTSSLSRAGLGVTPIAGVATPIEAGDRVVAIEGVGLEDWLRGRSVLGPLDTAAYRVNRGGSVVDLDVPLGSFPLATVLGENWGTLLLCAATLAVAVYVCARRPSAAGAAPLLVYASGLAGSTVPWMLGFGASDLAWRTGFWLWLIGAFGAYSLFWSAALHFALVFPRRLALARASGGIGLVYAVPIVLMSGWLAAVTITSGSLLDALGSATSVQLGIVLATSAAILVLLVVQYRSAATRHTRDQVRWIAWGAAIALGLTIAFWYVPELLTGRPILPWSAIGVAGMVFPVAVAIAVLRHRLFDIEVVINRSLVYGGLTAAVLAVYAATAALLGSVLRGEGSFAVSLLATGTSALVALPVRDWLQRTVNRLMYGDRDDPYRAISRLAEQLSTSLTTDEVLPTVVATVATALRLPHAAIELRQDGRTTIVASTGRRTDGDLERMPLIDQGEVIGELVVSPRSVHEGFSHADRELLAGLAREAGKAARSVRLSAEIARSRRELVAAREEERRRLRRDLHDGLGPTLAGARLKVQAAREMAGTRPDDATAVLNDLDAELAELLDEVRRISRDLRPPVLDELGLMPALRARAAQFAIDAGLDLAIDGPEELPPLPAAVEAAAYRITLEALANVRRHSSASRCAVRVRLAGGLEIEVEDDGSGIPPGTPRGVGLTSMRERATEVGGSFEIESGSGSGTRILARLPLPVGGTA